MGTLSLRLLEVLALQVVTIQAVRKKFILLSIKQDICCGYSKERLNEAGFWGNRNMLILMGLRIIKRSNKS